MQKMMILVGLPASGKSTYAMNLLGKNADWARINYDDLRWSGLNGVGYIYSKENEKAIKQAAIAQLREYAGRGYSVIIDNTNLTQAVRDRWINLAFELDMQVEVKEFTTSLDECVRLDARRNGWRHVGRAVIERMALWSGRFQPEVRPLVLVDMDGTLADLSHRYKYISGECPMSYAITNRCNYGKVSSCSGPEMYDCPTCHGAGAVKKDWTNFFGKVSEDTLIRPVAQWVRSLESQYCICIVSGRPIDKAGKATVEWLAKHEIPYDRIFMRNSGDKRPDIIVKKEILDKILVNHKVAFAIDDRPCVIRMWRENGIKTYDVGNGVEF